MKRELKDRDFLNLENKTALIAAESGVTISTTTDGAVNVTKITLASSTIGTVASASLGFGKKLFTFPLGKIDVLRVCTKLAITAHAGCTVKPIVGYGTVVASGAVIALSGTTTFEDYVSGAPTDSLNEATPVTLERTLGGELDIKDGSTTAKDFFLNMAIGWATNGTITASGDIVIIWSCF